MTDSPFFAIPSGRVRLVGLAEVIGTPLWKASLAYAARDSRWYELVDATLGEAFESRVLVIESEAGIPRAIQPCFFVEQDLVLTAPPVIRHVVGWLRRRRPRLLRLRMLMLGCAAGEGIVCIADSADLAAFAGVLPVIARAFGASLIVWKDIPSSHRSALQSLAPYFTRTPSMPATRLALEFGSFEAYLGARLSHAMRKNLRRKFRASAEAAPITFSVTSSVAAEVDEVLDLYQQVLSRSSLQFERLTRDFFLQLGERMADRVRFFLWRQEGRLVAMSLCLVHDGILYDEYLGLDYRVALDQHLYFVTFRDVLTWAISQGLTAYHSTPLNYDPKLHLGFDLAPLDLYAAPAARWQQPILRHILPWIAPTRGEPVLQKFTNSDEL